MSGRLGIRTGVALVFLALSVSGARGDGDQSGSSIVTTSTQQLPPRDRVTAPVAGRSALRGRVIDGQNGAALPRARVRLMGRGSVPPMVLTDDQGLFTFTRLQAGAYTVSAEKATYNSGSYPDRSGSLRSSATRPLVLKDGEAIDNVLIRLYRGSAIAGRVLDAHGDPVESAQVYAVPVNSSGTVRAQFRSMTSTNDIGEFRVARVPPGRYLVMANAPQRGVQEPPNVEPARLPQPLPTYFPSALSRGEAQPIAVGRGQTLSGVDIVMFEGTPTVVTGRVIAADGQPVRSGNGSAFVNVRLDERSSMAMVSANTSVQPDGSFRLLLAPGNYVVEARSMQPSDAAGQGRQTERYGMTRFAVVGESTEVSVLIAAGATASGRVVFEGDTPPPAPPARASAPLTAEDGGTCRAGQLEIAPDWTFRLDGLMGTCSAPQYVGFGRWTLKSVVFGNQELKDGSLTFEPGQHYGNVQILVTDRRSELNLHVTDEQGQATRDYVALVFSTDKSRWDASFSPVRTFVPPSSEMLELMQQRVAATPVVPSAQPVPTNREMIMGLKSGEYYAIAVDDIGAEDSRDPAVLERLSSSASRVTIGEGPTDVTLLRLKLADVIR
jgi:protocatechuate 3,4-dioxygenase beta subunit